MNIPKIIHQIWLQGEDVIPEKFLPYIDKIKKFHPTWEYMLWDNVSIINLLRKNEIWIETYYKLRYLHQKVDYARYIILYEYGGIYIDMDVKIVKKLDTLFEKYNDYELIVSKVNLNHFESMVYCGRKICINNGIIIAKPKNSVLNKIIEYVIKHPVYNRSITKFDYISNTTGPIMFTKIILDNLNDKIKILEPEYLEPRVLGVGDITDNTYAIHDHEGSWYSKKFKFFNVIYFKTKKIIRKIFFLLL